MSVQITVLVNGQVKIVDSSDSSTRYFQNNLCNATVDGTARFNISDADEKLYGYLVSDVTVPGVFPDSETLCDVLNAQPYFFT